MTFEEYEREHLQGYSGEFIRLVRMGWNARGSYGDTNETSVTGHEYSQGICGDGIAILKDGQPMTPEEVIRQLAAAEERIAVQNEKLDCADHIADAGKMVRGNVQAMGDLHFNEEDDYKSAVVIEFDSREDFKAAMQAGRCEFGILGGDA